MAADIQEAARITGMAQMTVLGLDLIGMYEWEVKEVIDQVFDDEGADYFNAFSHIVASGPNAIELHYSGGDRMIEDGDLLLMDIGARYNSYCGDITRTIPANGTYTPRQAELYQLVLDCQAAAAAHMQPGVHSLRDMTDWANEYFAASPLRALDENGVERTMDYFFIHSLSHYIGKFVHGEDLGLSTYDPVEIGYVFSIEPGLYIESEGIGIRIEDDYVMTENGAVNVYKQTPKTIGDVEAWMARARASGHPLQSMLDDIEEPAVRHGAYTDHMNF
jgi:Xaa-Pro aminopeptidase